MDVAAFDRWRANYDRMSYQEQVKFYNQVALDHPHQVHFDALAYARFFEYVAQRQRTFGVLEVGGWKGELAGAMLARFPDILIWVNYEISPLAVEDSVCTNERYHPVVAGDFVWRVSLPPTDVLVMSHTIEHVKAHELASLWNNLPDTARYIGLQAPLVEKGENVSWDGYWGSHILEIGWAEVAVQLAQVGFDLVDDLCVGEFRAFEKVRF